MQPILTIPHPLRQGSQGQYVRVAQEWLSLRLGNPYPARIDDKPLACEPDGDFGPQTERCVKQFQRGRGLLDSGEIDQDLFGMLVRPMTEALITPLPRDTLAATVVSVAEVHLKQGPREVGGDNHGPFVRLYCDGAEGLPWCAAFASFVVRQAAELMRVRNPVDHELACDSIAHDALNRGALIQGCHGITPGMLFLLKAPPGADRQFRHTGIVTGVEGDRIATIEGNSNNDGSVNGHCVVARTRKAHDLCFVRI